jgi:glycosyltransferase involved in cell wall biosynthesis
MAPAVPKSLCIDARMLFFGGIGTVVQNVVKRLPEDLWSYQFLVGEKRTADWIREHGPKGRVELVSSQIYSIGEQLRLPWQGSSADVFWSPHYNIPLFFPGRIIATIHDVLHVVHPEYFPGLLKRVYAEIMFRAVMRRCQQVVCISEFTAEELSRVTGASRSRIKVIPNGVDETWFKKPKPEIPSEPYFIYVGGSKPHKNLLRLLEAFSGIVDRLPHRLVLVGKRAGYFTGYPQVEEMVARLGPRVQLTEWIHEDQLHVLVGGATALVFPSLYEGFGLPPLEAMAAGCPVLASRAGPMPEVCGPAVTYFDPTSTEEMQGAMLGTAAWTPEERARLIEPGIERARLYSWDRTARLLLEVFEKAASDRN